MARRTRTTPDTRVTTMPRAVPEWVGKTPDAAIPNGVKLRVLDRALGVCQCGCGWDLRPWDTLEYDHIVALINGGENRESNLQVLLAAHHKYKTKKDVKLRTRARKTRVSHLGLKKRGRTIPGRRFDGTPIPPRQR
jgi:hypothetical protein